MSLEKWGLQTVSIAWVERSNVPCTGTDFLNLPGIRMQGKKNKRVGRRLRSNSRKPWVLGKEYWLFLWVKIVPLVFINFFLHAQNGSDSFLGHLTDGIWQGWLRLRFLWWSLCLSLLFPLLCFSSQAYGVGTKPRCWEPEFLISEWVWASLSPFLLTSHKCHVNGTHWPKDRQKDRFWMVSRSTLFSTQQMAGGMYGWGNQNKMHLFPSVPLFCFS